MTEPRFPDPIVALARYLLKAVPCPTRVERVTGHVADERYVHPDPCPDCGPVRQIVETGGQG